MTGPGKVYRDFFYFSGLLSEAVESCIIKFYRLFLSESRRIIHNMFAFIGVHEFTPFGFVAIV